MLRSGKAKVAKEKFYGGREPINIWNVDVDNMFISNLIEMNNNSKYLNGDLYLQSWTQYFDTF